MTNATGKNENQTQLLTNEFNLNDPCSRRGNSSFFYGRTAMEILSVRSLEWFAQCRDSIQEIFQSPISIHFPLVSSLQVCRIANPQVRQFSLDVKLDIRPI